MHVLPTLILREVLILKQKLEERPHRRSGCGGAVHVDSAIGKPRADRLVHVYHCESIIEQDQHSSTGNCGDRRTVADIVPAIWVNHRRLIVRVNLARSIFWTDCEKLVHCAQQHPSNTCLGTVLS